MMPEKLICIDFEASSLAPSGYPIEVAITDVATGSVRQWLICPLPEWLLLHDWDPASEKVHGIALDFLIKEGNPVNLVVRDLTELTHDAVVLSDSPRHDGKWLRDLYRAAGFDDPPIVLRDLHQTAWELALRAGRRPDIAFVKAEAEARIVFPQEHRAAPDACRNAEILRHILGISIG